MKQAKEKPGGFESARGRRDAMPNQFSHKCPRIASPPLAHRG